MDEVIPNLFVGDYTSAGNLKELSRAGITHIVVAGHELQPRFPESFTYLHCRLADDKEVSLEPHARVCIEFMHSAFAKNGKLLIHCRAGISRSVSLASMCIANAQNIPGKDALYHVRCVRRYRFPCTPPIAGFVAQIEDIK